jgi:processive 1,2-diacylglycerol beta-glucosyltransferase
MAAAVTTSLEISLMNAHSALIVSASAGTGHVSAGRALHAAFESAGCAQVVHVDVLDLAPRWVRAAYGGGFELLASRAPGVWREVYRRSDGHTDDARWGTIARRLIFREFERLLTAERWSFCVCTHFLPAQLAAGRPNVPPFASVVTDFALHRYWVQPRVSQYFVATPDMARDLHARLPAARVVATGIPVAPAFADRVPQSQARSRLDLPLTGTLALVMGGGLGIGVEETTRAALESGIPDLHVVAACGRNDTARARLELLNAGDRLRVLGFVDDIATLIAGADVVITKPGGLTSSEALAIGRPLILTRAIPGHEEANVQYLTSRGAALAAPTTADVAPALRNLLHDPEVLARYTWSAHGAGTPGAAPGIAACLMRRLSRTSVA